MTSERIPRQQPNLMAASVSGVETLVGPNLSSIRSVDTRC